VQAYNSIVISPAGADFTASLTTDVTTIGLNNIITVILTATNVGQQDAIIALPRTAPAIPQSVTPTVSGAGNAIIVPLTGGPAPLEYATVTQNSVISFTWTFSAVAGGNVTFNSGLYWTYNDPIVGLQNKNLPVSSGVVSIQYGVAQPGAGDHCYLSANQFNPALGQRVDVVFSVANAASSSSLTIFNVAGQKVRTITSSSPVAPDIRYTQLLYWDGKADDGKLVTTGIYYIKLKAGSYEAVKMVAVIKQ
jgi:hypothetical protein